MSLDVARRLALGAQGFGDQPPTGAVTKRHIRRAMGRMRVVQLDSIPVVARTQYVPFLSRLGPYDMALLDRIAYRDGDFFEVWTHEASLLPVESEPLVRWTFERARAGHTWKSLQEISVRAPKYTPDTGIRSTKIPGVSVSVRPQYPTEYSSMVRYEVDTGTRHFGKFGTNSIPIPDTLVSSVLIRYRYPTLR